MTMNKFQKELNGGTVSLVVLALLGRAGEPLYGYQISRILESVARLPLPMKQGTLYPVLRALEREGQLESTVKPGESGPARRYYRITADGRTTLPLWREAWDRTRDFVDRVLDAEGLAPALAEQGVEGRDHE